MALAASRVWLDGNGGLKRLGPRRRLEATCLEMAGIFGSYASIARLLAANLQGSAHEAMWIRWK